MPSMESSESSDPEEYVVEAVVDDRVIGGKRFFRLKWEGYSSDENTWEPEEFLRCNQLVEDYLRKKRADQLAHMYPTGFDLGQLLTCPKKHHIRVINTEDDAKLDPSFIYTDGYIRGKNVPYPPGVVFPCNCVGEKCGDDCECMGVSYYDENERLCTELQTAIHECNYLCKCSIKCPNRLVQRANHIYMDVFRTKFKGWGARTRVPIKKGEYVCRYTGELISFEDSTLRDAEHTTYLFDLDHETIRGANSHFTVDARTYGNISHFFNHSCDPNLVIKAVYINHLDPRLHELAFFASRDIDANEEVTFDYSPNFVPTFKKEDDEDPASKGSKETKFRCFCGTPTCRRFIF